MMIITSFPLSVISFGSGGVAPGDTMSVPYDPDMTLGEFVKYINKGAGIDENTPSSEWTWLANGAADYRYGKYLVDIKYDKFGFDIDRKDVDIIYCLDIYRQYQNGDITEEELKENYGDVDMMFNDVQFDADKLESTIEDAIDAARRNFRRNKVYVPLEGKSTVVTDLVIELDHNKDPHCVYQATVGGMVEETLYLPTRLVVSGTESYDPVLTAFANGEIVTVSHGGKDYKVRALNVDYSEVILKGNDGYTYPISYNTAKGDDEGDILKQIYSTVIDFEKSKLKDDFNKEEMNGFTIRFYDKQTGWYVFDEQYTDRIKTGEVYDVELVYEGDSTVTVEFQIAILDPRQKPAIAIYEDEKLVIDSNEDIEAIKQAIFEYMIDKSDLPADIKYTDFDYYYLFGGYDGIANFVETDPDAEEKFESFKEAYYDEIWETAIASMDDHPVFEHVSKEEFKEKYFTKETLATLIRDVRWVDLEGGYTPITMEIEGTEVVLFDMDVPRIFAAHNHEIKVVYRGNDEYAPTECETDVRVLQIVAKDSDLEVIEGNHKAGSDLLSNMLNDSMGLDYTLIALELDTEFLEITNVYFNFPEFAHTMGLLKFENGETVDGLDYLKKYLAMEDYKLDELSGLLNNLANSEMGNSALMSLASLLDEMVSKLPESAFEAPVNYNGMKTDREGTYLITAITTDLDGVMNHMDNGIVFVTNELDNEYQIIFDNEIPFDGLYIDHGFDFSAHIFNSDFEICEEEPAASSFYLGFPSNSDKMYLSYTEPNEKGQYVQISEAGVTNSAYRYFDIALTKVTIESPADSFEYDGKPHGAPYIYDYMGNVIETNEDDTLIFTNIITGEYTSTAPTKPGEYSVTVYFDGREDYAAAMASYTFTIVPKVVEIWVDDVTITYGDKLPEFKVYCKDEGVLENIDFTVAPGIGYRGQAGTFPINITINDAPEGYLIKKSSGVLTVNKRALSIEMNDIYVDYGDGFTKNEDYYYTVKEGTLAENDTLGLVFDEYSSSGEFTFAPVDYLNKSYDLTIEPGTITVLRKKVTINIFNAFMFEGDELPEFRYSGDVPSGLKIHIAPSYYDMEVGGYLLVAYVENTNYELIFNEGWLYVLNQPPKSVDVVFPDHVITYGDKLPEFKYESSEKLEGVDFIVTVEDENGEYNGDAGEYNLVVMAYGENEEDYSFNITAGKLIVERKMVTVNIEDYTVEYGTPFNPETQYKITCDDKTVDLSQIEFEIGAENYNGNAGSYLFVGMGISKNYNVKVESATLTVNPKEIEVRPVIGQGKYEGEADTTIKYQVDGLVGKDILFGQLTREEGEEIGAYEILMGTLSNPNYKINLQKTYYGVRSKEYRGIRIDKLPDNLVYLQGTPITLDGAEIVAIKGNREEMLLDYKEIEVLGYDMNKLGEQMVTISYKGHTATFNVFVRPTEVLNLKVDKLPDKLVYIEGQEFSYEGSTMVVFYDNGTYQYVDTSFAKFYGYDMNKVGKQNVICEYAGMTDVFEITVVPKNALGLELDTSNARLEFVQGMKFDYSGLKVYIVYDNGSLIDVTNDAHIEGYDMDSVGKQTVVVKCGDFITSYTITVDKKRATALDIVFEGDELYAVLNSKFNPNQLKVTAHYNDGTSKVLEYGEYTIDGYNISSIGIWQANVKCEELIYPVKVRVVASEIKSIEITKKPDNRVFTVGEDIDLSGMEITVHFYNGDKKTVDSWSVYNYDKELIGKQMVTISYLGYKADLAVSVVPESFSAIKIEKLPTNRVFTEKTKEDFSGLRVNMVADGKETPIDIECLDFRGYDMSVIGKQKVTVVFGKAKAAFEIEIIEKEVESIIPVYDNPVVYYLGEEIDISVFDLKIIYNNGEMEIIPLTEDMIGGYNNQIRGRQGISVSYGKKKAEIFVWFIYDDITGIVITKPADETIFKENTYFSADGLEVMVKYADGTFDKVLSEDLDYEDFDMSVVGKQSVTVRYATATAAYGIEIIPKELESIAINTIPHKNQYIMGEKLNPEGLSLILYYDNGQYEVVNNVADFKFTGFNSQIPGEKEVTVIYMGKETTFNVTVIPVSPVGIRVDATHAKYTYYLHNMVTTDGLNVYLIHNNGEETTVSASECVISKYDPFKLGTQKVTVEYMGFTDEFTIEMVTGEVIGIRLDYSEMPTETIKGLSHKFDLLKVIALYADGDEYRIATEAFTVENYDCTMVGEQQVKISYGGFSQYLTLTVLPDFSLDYVISGTDSTVFSSHEKGLVINKLGYTVTVDEIKKILTGGEYLVVRDKNGELLDDDDRVGTGTKLEFEFDGNVYASYDVIMKGDVNGDGILNITDAVIARHAVAKSYELSELEKIAADVAENNGFNITDAVLIRHTVAKK